MSPPAAEARRAPSGHHLAKGRHSTNRPRSIHAESRARQLPIFAGSRPQRSESQVLAELLTPAGALVGRRANEAVSRRTPPSPPYLILWASSYPITDAGLCRPDVQFGLCPGSPTEESDSSDSVKQ